MSYDTEKYPPHPNQAENEHLLKAIFSDKSGNEVPEQYAQEILDAAGLDTDKTHISGISKMGMPSVSIMTGIFVSAVSADYAVEAKEKLRSSAMARGYKLERFTYNQSHF